LNTSREKARKIKNIVLLLFLIGLIAYLLGAVSFSLPN
jgi:cbb3-type cytochrome oxidase subunit 3